MSVGYNYMQLREGFRTTVRGLTADADHPDTSGLDHHHLYRDNVNPKLKNTINAQDRRPYPTGS